MIERYHLTDRVIVGAMHWKLTFSDPAVIDAFVAHAGLAAYGSGPLDQAGGFRPTWWQDPTGAIWESFGECHQGDRCNFLWLQRDLGIAFVEYQGG